MGKILSAHQRIIERVKAHPFFAGVPVFSKRDSDGDIQTMIDEAANLGLGVVIFYRGATVEEPESLALTWRCQWALTATEDIFLNKTGKFPEDATETMAELLHGTANGVSDASTPEFFHCDANSERPIPAPRDRPTLNIRVLYLNTRIPIK